MNETSNQLVNNLNILYIYHITYTVAIMYFWFIRRTNMGQQIAKVLFTLLCEISLKLIAQSNKFWKSNLKKNPQETKQTLKNKNQYINKTPHNLKIPVATRKGTEKGLRDIFKNWMFNFVSWLKYKRQMKGNKLCKPAQRSGAGLHIICYMSSDVYISINWKNYTFNSYDYRGLIFSRYRAPMLARAPWMALATVTG